MSWNLSLDIWQFQAELRANIHSIHRILYLDRAVQVQTRLDTVNMGWGLSLTLSYVLGPVPGYLIDPSWAQSQYSQYPQDPVSGSGDPDTDSPGYCEYGLRPQLDSTLCPGTCPWISDKSKLSSEPIFTVSTGSCIWTRRSRYRLAWILWIWAEASAWLYLMSWDLSLHIW